MKTKPTCTCRSNRSRKLSRAHTTKSNARNDLSAPLQPKNQVLMPDQSRELSHAPPLKQTDRQAATPARDALPTLTLSEPFPCLADPCSRIAMIYHGISSHFFPLKPSPAHAPKPTLCNPPIHPTRSHLRPSTSTSSPQPWCSPPSHHPTSNLLPTS